MALQKLEPPVFAAPAAPQQAEPGSAAVQANTAWTVLGGIGLLLLIVGAADLVLTWIPLGIGNPEWEFGTVTATLDGLPVLTLGTALVLGAGLAHDDRRVIRAAAVLFGLMGVALVLAMILYLTNLPFALRMVSDPTLRVGLMRAILKTSVQGLAYPLVFLWIAVRSWR